MWCTSVDSTARRTTLTSLGRQKRFTSEFDVPVGRNVDPSLKFASKYRFVWKTPYHAGSLRAVVIAASDYFVFLRMFSAR